VRGTLGSIGAVFMNDDALIPFMFRNVRNSFFSGKSLEASVIQSYTARASIQADKKKLEADKMLGQLPHAEKSVAAQVRSQGDLAGSSVPTTDGITVLKYGDPVPVELKVVEKKSTIIEDDDGEFSG